MNKGTTMNDYRKLPTSAEVWAVLKAKHGAELRVYGSYSAPEGDSMGDPSKAVMMTEYGFEDGKWPLMGARTTWDLGGRPPGMREYERFNERTEYWLCYRTEAQHEADG
jgi:hypothetical protein